MASPNTLAVRDVKKAQKAQRRAAEQQAAQQREQGQAAAQFITGLARDIYARNVIFAEQSENAEEKLRCYTFQAHAAMDAAIAFVRASNSYDDRGTVPAEAPPIIAPTDANGTPVTE